MRSDSKHAVCVLNSVVVTHLKTPVVGVRCERDGVREGGTSTWIFQSSLTGIRLFSSKTRLLEQFEIGIHVVPGPHDSMCHLILWTRLDKVDKSRLLP